MPDEPVLKPSTTSLLQSEVDAILVPLFQSGELTGNADAADQALDGLLWDMRERREFRGEVGQVALVPTLGRLPARRMALVGLGKQADFGRTALRHAFMAAFRTLGKRGVQIAAADVQDVPVPAEEAAEILAEAAVLSTYVPDPYRTGERRDSHVTEVRVSGAADSALREGAIRGRAKNLARDLTNEPANVLDPPELAKRAAVMAKEVGLDCEVFGLEEMEALGMTSILTVTRGSEIPAQFIILRHNGGGDGPLLALVGKAVTFDTGGISIKPSAEMGRMKGDMAGGAAVVGAMRAIAELKLPVNVVGLVPASQNMPDGRAWRPGDVVTTMSGKTVETMTTDAEGRMLLADAITYARRLEAAAIVDIATLTGACVVALGHVASGLYGTDEALTQAVKTAGEAAGERHWPMPLYPEYRELNRSEIADLKNSGGRYAGSVTAAWFVREFAGETAWAHLDVAGTSSYEKTKAWAPAGPTGTGVGTFINLAKWFGEREQ